MSIEQEVLASITPTPDENNKIQEAIASLKQRIATSPDFNEADIELYLVGSIARGTYLKNPDIDMFLLFDPSIPRSELERRGVAIGKHAIGGEEHYAEHPYIKGEFMGFMTDIVPAYKLDDASQKMTAVDRTPFHTRYIVEHIDDGLLNDIRLLKKFMKAIGVYGAEIKTRGFSGYLSELLVIRYGSFRGVLEAAKKWKKHERLSLDASQDRKFEDPLIFIDPVDTNRNVASPVSLDTFSLFVHAAGEYLKNPDIRFFFPAEYMPMSREEIERTMEKRADMMAIRFRRPELIDDVFFGQLKKFEKTILQLLENNDFGILHSMVFTDEEHASIIIELISYSLPDARVHLGPPVWIQDNSRDFIERWKSDEGALSSPYIEDGNWKVVVRRKHTDAISLIEANLPRLDIGKNLNKLKEELEFAGPEKITSLISSEALSRFLDKRMPWEIT